MCVDLNLRADANTQYDQIYETYRATRAMQGKVNWMFLLVNGALLGSGKWLIIDPDEPMLAWAGVCLLGLLSCWVVAAQIVSYNRIVVGLRDRIAVLEGCENDLQKCSMRAVSGVAEPRVLPVAWISFCVGALAWTAFCVLGMWFG